MNYYDMLLSLIPVTLGTSGVLAFLDVQPAIAPAAIALLLVLHGLFVRAPTDLSAIHPKE